MYSVGLEYLFIILLFKEKNHYAYLNSNIIPTQQIVFGACWVTD